MKAVNTISMTNTPTPTRARCHLTKTKCRDFLAEIRGSATITSFTTNIKAYKDRYNLKRVPHSRNALFTAEQVFLKKFKMASEKTRENKRKNEQTRVLRLLNHFHRKKFQKSIDKDKAMCYNMKA